MLTFLKIIYFFFGCLIALYMLGAGIVGSGNIANGDDAAIAFIVGIGWAIAYWPVTLVVLALAIWLLARWGR